MPFTAIVVGAGIAGLATAIALRQAGFEVLILERRSTIAEVGYAIDVPPNATRILKQYFHMNLEKLRGCLQTGVDVFRADVEPMEWIRSENRHVEDDAPFLSVHRVDYHEALRDLALGEHGRGKPAQLRCNCKVTSYCVEEGNVVLDSGETLRADLIVAADGNRSVAHRWVVGQELPARRTGLSNIRFVVPTATMLQHEGMAKMVERTRTRMAVYMDAQGDFVAHYACRGGDLQNFGIYSQDDPNKETQTLKTKKELAMERVGHMSTEITALTTFIDEDETYLWEIVDREPLTNMHAGKLVLVGDANHPMQPKMGQGAAQAIEDAAVLGAVMDNVESRESIPDRLALWEKLRKPRASAIQLMSRTGPFDGWRSEKDQDQARQYFRERELPLTRNDMTAWAFTYDAVYEAWVAKIAM